MVAREIPPEQTRGFWYQIVEEEEEDFWVLSPSVKISDRWVGPAAGPASARRPGGSSPVPCTLERTSRARP